jgi:hypothetical protein
MYTPNTYTGKLCACREALRKKNPGARGPRRMLKTIWDAHTHTFKYTNTLTHTLTHLKKAAGRHFSFAPILGFFHIYTTSLFTHFDKALTARHIPLSLHPRGVIQLLVLPTPSHIRTHSAGALPLPR